jgi:hypothetical protein
VRKAYDLIVSVPDEPHGVDQWSAVVVESRPGRE